MKDQLHQRLMRLFDDLVFKHLDLLILLVAEQGEGAQSQRDRAERLVRTLFGSTVCDTLSDQGRRIPLSLENSGDLPALQFSVEMMSQVSDEEIFNSLARPISQILDVPAINVGLVLQGHDDKQLLNLYHTGRRRLDVEVVRAASLRAVIERRIYNFGQRLRLFVERLVDGARVKLSSPVAFLSHVEALPGWPEWLDIELHPFISTLVTQTEEAIEGAESIPPASTLVEICWESLAVSPQTFLRTASRSLRTKNLPLNERVLGAMADIAAQGRVEQVVSLHAWPSLRDLEHAWHTLVTLEYDTLGRHHHGDRVIPKVNVLHAPRDAMGLREPVELPWDVPLAAWSVRETTALRDLLQGFVQAQRVEDGQEKEPEHLLVEQGEEGEPPLSLEGDRRHVELRIVSGKLGMPSGYEVMRERATESVVRRLKAQMDALGQGQTRGVLARMRGAYDGFFMGTKHVWERRLQGWQLDAPDVALKRLTQEVSLLFGCPVLFDPFEAPDVDQLRPMPTFCFIVPISSSLDRASFSIPLSALTMTDATGLPPIRVRIVEVPSTSVAPCRWICDRELTIEDLSGEPIPTTLNAIEDDMLRLIAVG